MSRRYPYTLYVCPCTDSPTSSVPFDRIPKDTDGDDGSEDQTFDPHSNRANFSLYPLDQLLFCNDCHEIRCPRCYFEEALVYHCPSCLFEVSSNIVKTETNRCTRSCFQCPICIAPLAIQSLGNAEERGQTNEASGTREGPCMLACLYCSWTSLDAGLRFDRPVNISGQLAKLLADVSPQESPKPRDTLTRTLSDSMRTPDPYLNKPAPNDQFMHLASFYKAQIAETSPAGPLGLGFGSSLGLDSPSQLSRLLTTYGVGGLQKQRGRMPVMREALTVAEGLHINDPSEDEAIIARMRDADWDDLSSISQQQDQEHQQRPGHRSHRFTSDLLPLATQLRSKCAKRCRTCRHNLVKPDEKRQRNKFSIRLVALNYLPHTTLRPLDPTVNLDALKPHKTVQYLLTLRNALFDPIRVTLATPRETPGTVKSKITILCPQFDVGAMKDDWSEALDEAGATNMDDERRKAREGLEGFQAEAGKIWKKGKSWTTVVVEVVPGVLTQKALKVSDEEREGADEDHSSQVDEDLLEIPIFVRIEYDTDESMGDASAEEPKGKIGKDKKIRREIAYWCVVGAGRITA